MKGYQIFTTCTLGLLVLGFAFPMETMARPKGSAANCNTKDLNTNFGASCNDQMQQDVINHTLMSSSVAERPCSVAPSITAPDKSKRAASPPEPASCPGLTARTSALRELLEFRGEALKVVTQRMKRLRSLLR